MVRALTVAAATLFVAGLLPAHGGQYRGRFDSPPSPGQPPGSPGVNTGARPIAPTSLAWETWWEFNKEPLLQRRAVGSRAAVTGGDDHFYLGLRRPETPYEPDAPTDADRRDVLAPAIAKLLQAERNRDIASAGLVALGKIGSEPPEGSLERLLTASIARDDQEIRETAVLALGIAGHAAALQPLLDLAGDTKAGRRIADRETIDERTRAFATFALGLLAHRSDDVATKRRVHDFCVAAVDDEDKPSYEVRVAALNALGILRLDAGDAVRKRLAWQTIDELLGIYDRELAPGDEPMLAHAAVAAGRLLGRGTSAAHQRAKERFAEELTAKKPRSAPLRRGAVIALGMLALPPEQHPADEAFSAVLRTTWSEGVDQHERPLALISLGRIGGAANRELLMKALIRGKRADERTWAAIGLGLQAFDRSARDDVDVDLAELLVRELRDAREESYRGALAIAIGLTGHVPMAPELRKVLRDTERDQVSAGHLCTALALLGDREALPQIDELLQRNVRRTFLLTNGARAMGMLGDRDASMRLVAIMQDNDSVAVLGSVATALGRIGDRRAIPPLLELLRAPEQSKLARAFVIAALGAIGDTYELPWSVPYTVDSSYTTPTETLLNGRSGVFDIL